MAKYDWAELKRDYILGDYKSLRCFAETKGIPYKTVEDKARGWVKEKQGKDREKTGKIIEAVTDQEVRYAIDRNAAHLATGDLIMAKLNLAIGSVKVKDKGALHLLQSAAATLERVQKVQAACAPDIDAEGVTIVDDL